MGSRRLNGGGEGQAPLLTKGRVDVMEGRRDTNHSYLLPSTSYEPGSFLRT